MATSIPQKLDQSPDTESGCRLSSLPLKRNSPSSSMAI